MLKMFLAVTLTAAMSLPVLAQDDAKAERLFRRCGTCHTLEEGGPNRIGPNLHGVFERGIGQKEGFRYSKGMAALGGQWTDAQMDQFLLSPRTFLRDTKMAFAGIRKTGDRALLIDWLKRKTASTEGETDTLAAADPDLALLPDGPGKQETFDNCASCHSIKLVVQQGLDEDGWAEVIEWMVDEQGMDEIGDDLALQITRYLATHFGLDRPNFPQ